MNPELEALLEMFRENDFPEFSGTGVENPFVRCPLTGDGLLHFVCRWGDLDAARLLLDEGLEIDLPGDCDCTALHCAIGSKKPELVKLLLSRGADPTKKCMFGSAFEMGTVSDCPEITQIFTNDTLA